MSRVTVVVPAFNNAEFIAETLRSILGQNYEDFSVVVADHASTDDTRSIVESFLDDERVTLIDTAGGGGAARNWRRVTEAASGELIKLVCGDDLLAQSALREQVAAFDANPDAVLVSSRRDIVDARGEVLFGSRGLGHLTGLVDGHDAIVASVRAGTNLLGEPACVLLRREAFLEVGSWDENESYLIDQASYARILTQGPMVALSRSHASFRLNAGQWSIALARSQAGQAKRFHAKLLAAGIVTRSDARIGDLRATITAVARRAVYLVYAHRLRPRRVIAA